MKPLRFSPLLSDLISPCQEFSSCAYPVDVQCADVVRHADVVMLPETAVGKDERTVLTGGKYIFGGVIDGVCQQGDVIAPLLDVGDVLYVAFQNAGSVG